MKSAAAHIRNAMRMHALNQAQTAARLGISEGYLSKILAGSVSVSPFVAVRLENAFGISAQKLLLDQALVELGRARMEYAKEVAG